VKSQNIIPAKAISICYAEDERWFRDDIVELLENSGFEVLCAKSDGKALLDFTAITERRPDLYLTDLNMPEMNGIQLARELIARWPDSKVVLLSSEIAPYFIIEAKQAGAVAFLHKIIDHKNLISALREIHQNGHTQYGK